MESLPPLSPNLERTVGLAINNRNLDVIIRSPGGATDNIKIVGWRVLRGPWAGVRWQDWVPGGVSQHIHLKTRRRAFCRHTPHKLIEVCNYKQLYLFFVPIFQKGISTKLVLKDLNTFLRK